MAHFGFPLWLRVTHYTNFLLMTLLIRSGIQILADHPRLYWNEHCQPGSEWLRFTRKTIPPNRLWTSMDEAVPAPDWLGLPGGLHTLGIARHWHFLAALFWVCNGLTYVTLLFATRNWERLIPTSWQVVPDALHTMQVYLTLQVPPLSSFNPYDPLQQIAYGGVVFILAPLTILTGAAMSPAIAAQYPWYPRLFGGRQKARSIHFLLMVAYLGFLLVHVTMVFLVYFNRNVDHIILGIEQGHEQQAIGIGAVLLASVAIINWLANLWSTCSPRQVQHWTGFISAKILNWVLSGLRSRQRYARQEISPYFWVNGHPPESPEWQVAAKNQFDGWHLEINGLTAHPLRLSLGELKAMPRQEQITEHVCIQGWSGIAGWAGVPLGAILTRCQPLREAKFLVFHSYQTDEEGREYYSTLSLEEAVSPQTILAYEMNGKPLPIEHGAPLRLRIETKLGFKMTKWLRAIELVSDYRHIGMGQGGYREDTQYYAIGARI